MILDLLIVSFVHWIWIFWSKGNVNSTKPYFKGSSWAMILVLLTKVIRIHNIWKCAYSHRYPTDVFLLFKQLLNDSKGLNLNSLREYKMHQVLLFNLLQSYFYCKVYSNFVIMHHNIHSQSNYEMLAFIYWEIFIVLHEPNK